DYYCMIWYNNVYVLF
nr:immunoglobulin light chain junction region [Macaca mulatta]MOW03697.1 immunoglobulin light chain junction region [Macaca mulatta]